MLEPGSSSGIGGQRILRLLHRILPLNFACLLRALPFHNNPPVYSILLLLQFLMKTLLSFVSNLGVRAGPPTKFSALLWLLAYLNLVDLDFGLGISLGWVPRSPGNIPRISICVCSMDLMQSYLNNILELTLLEW